MVPAFFNYVQFGVHPNAPDDNKDVCVMEGNDEN